MEEAKPNPLNFVLPHSKVSRPVTQADFPTLDKVAFHMFELCVRPVGIYPGGYAVAHSQVEYENPLRFFVTSKGEIVCNPEIVRTTKTGFMKQEGCLSFPTKETTPVMRYHKCDVVYDRYIHGEGFKRIEKNVTGTEAQVFQHEIEHMNGHYIYEYQQGEATQDLYEA